jgi:hypothetical protein
LNWHVVQHSWSQALRVDSTHMRVKSTRKVFIQSYAGMSTRHGKHVPDASISKVYVYYDLFNVIFLVLMLWAQPHDLRLTLPPSYAKGYYVEFILKKKYRFWTRKLNRHVVRSCYKVTKNVDLSRIRIKITQLCVKITLVHAKIILCVWKSHSAYKNYTHACLNHTKHVEIALYV